MTCHEAGIIIWVQVLGATPLKCLGQKKSEIRRDFRQLKTSIRNISGTSRAIDEGKTVSSTAIPSTFDEKKLVNFDPLTKKSLSG